MGAWIALLLLVIAALALLLRADAGSIAGFDPSDFAILRGRRGAAHLHRLVACRQLSRAGRAGGARPAELGAGGAGAGRRLQLPRGAAEPWPSRGRRAVAAGHRSAGRAAGRGRAVGAASASGPTAISWSRPRPTASSLSMLVDTGASTVVLKPADAQRLGIDVDRLRYAVPVQTANGTTYAAQRAPAQPGGRQHQSWTMSRHWWPSPGPSRTTCSV